MNGPTLALAVRCPICASAAGTRCYHGNTPVEPHPERVALASREGKP